MAIQCGAEAGIFLVLIHLAREYAGALAASRERGRHCVGVRGFEAKRPEVLTALAAPADEPMKEASRMRIEQAVSDSSTVLG